MNPRRGVADVNPRRIGRAGVLERVGISPSDRAGGDRGTAGARRRRTGGEAERTESDARGWKVALVRRSEGPGDRASGRAASQLPIVAAGANRRPAAAASPMMRRRERAGPECRRPRDRCSHIGRQPQVAAIAWAFDRSSPVSMASRPGRSRTSARPPRQTSRRNSRRYRSDRRGRLLRTHRAAWVSEPVRPPQRSRACSTRREAAAAGRTGTRRRKYKKANGRGSVIPPGQRDDRET